jgi:hypothetical protein
MIKLTETQIAKFDANTELDINEWTPRNGETRLYINGLADVILDAGLTWNGSEWKHSNADYQRLQIAKFWIDTDNNLHIDKLEERGRILRADVEATISRIVAE